MSNTKPISSKNLPVNQQGEYSELLSQMESLGLTHKASTGLLDNNLSTEQDRQQIGQLDFIILGLTKILARQELQQVEILDIKNTVKRLPSIFSSLKPGTTPSGPSGTSNIGTTFLTYNPPDK